MCSDSIEYNWEIFKQLVNDAMIQFIPTSILLRPENLLHGGQKVYLKQSKLDILLSLDIGGLGLVLTMQTTRPNVHKCS